MTPRQITVCGGSLSAIEASTAAEVAKLKLFRAFFSESRRVKSYQCVIWWTFPSVLVRDGIESDEERKKFWRTINCVIGGWGIARTETNPNPLILHSSFRSNWAERLDDSNWDSALTFDDDTAMTTVQQYCLRWVDDGRRISGGFLSLSSPTDGTTISQTSYPYSRRFCWTRRWSMSRSRRKDVNCKHTKSCCRRVVHISR